VRVALDRVSTSCGFGVPSFEFDSDREALERWALGKGPEGPRGVSFEKESIEHRRVARVRRSQRCVTSRRGERGLHSRANSHRRRRGRRGRADLPHCADPLLVTAQPFRSRRSAPDASEARPLAPAPRRGPGCGGGRRLLPETGAPRSGRELTFAPGQASLPETISSRSARPAARRSCYRRSSPRWSWPPVRRR
jgi:hypothetical protein